MSTEQITRFREIQERIAADALLHGDSILHALEAARIKFIEDCKSGPT